MGPTQRGAGRFAQAYYCRPKRSFGQGNIFTPVCHSVHGGGVLGLVWGGFLQILGGVSNFSVGSSKFLGGCLQFFGVGGSSKFLGGVRGVSPNFRGVSNFSGGRVPPNFRGVSNFRNKVNIRPVRILLECILVWLFFAENSMKMKELGPGPASLVPPLRSKNFFNFFQFWEILTE